METLLFVLIALLSGAICAVAGFWFYRTAQERKRNIGRLQLAPEIAQRPVRNAAWDRAVRNARNRNW